MIRVKRLPFIVLAMLTLITGLLTGLSRIGWDFFFLPVTNHHGAIMIGGFLGTLITLEKIIPLKNRWLYLIPVLSAISVVLFYSNLPSLSMFLLILASIGLTGVFLIYLIRERSIIYTVMLAGSICWTTGNMLLLLKNFYPSSLPWWMGFVLFIITSERLELMKFLPVKQRDKNLFIMLLLTYGIACFLSFHGLGKIMAGISITGISVWLMRFDLIGITIHKKGLTKFIAIALLAGYFSLLVTGIFLITLSTQPFSYDIIIHSFFIGFVFSMIFAHGPIILPGVLGISLKPYSNILYYWLMLLHASWVLRTLADILLHYDWKKYSGIVSAIAIIGYFITIAWLTFGKKDHATIS
jgi:hypothetical protein